MKTPKILQRLLRKKRAAPPQSTANAPAVNTATVKPPGRARKAWQSIRRASATAFRTVGWGLVSFAKVVVWMPVAFIACWVWRFRRPATVVVLLAVAGGTYYLAELVVPIQPPQVATYNRAMERFRDDRATVAKSGLLNWLPFAGSASVVQGVARPPDVDVGEQSTQAFDEMQYAPLWARILYGPLDSEMVVLRCDMLNKLGVIYAQQDDEGKRINARDFLEKAGECNPGSPYTSVLSQEQINLLSRERLAISHNLELMYAGNGGQGNPEEMKQDASPDKSQEQQQRDKQDKEQKQQKQKKDQKQKKQKPDGKKDKKRQDGKDPPPDAEQQPDKQKSEQPNQGQQDQAPPDQQDRQQQDPQQQPGQQQEKPSQSKQDKQKGQKPGDKGNNPGQSDSPPPEQPPEPNGDKNHDPSKTGGSPNGAPASVPGRERAPNDAV